MRLILVRHGEKQPLSGFPEAAWPLTPAAREQVRNLREQLEQLGFVLACCLTSRWQHAVDTASLLAADGDAKVLPVTGLTPHTDDRFFTLAAILEEAQQNGLSIADTQTAVLVAHHPRTSHLAKALTGTEPPELGRLEALILADMPLAKLTEGQSWIEGRCFGARYNDVQRSR